MVGVDGKGVGVEPRPAEPVVVHNGAADRLVLAGGAWLTAAEVAAIYKVSRSTVYKWASADVFPSTKIAGTRRFERAAVEAALRGAS